MVHGYNHDPADPLHSASRPGGVFELWNGMLQGFSLLPWHWYSGRTGWKGRLRAISAGYYRNTYAYAYSVLAPLEAGKLVASLKTTTGPYDIIAHSLGARVALLAVEMAPELFRRVLILNGAETSSNAHTIITTFPEIEFLNICVEEDDVLGSFGGLFEPEVGYHGCMGEDGIFGLEVDNYAQIFLDLPLYKDKFRTSKGWTLEGNSPSDWGDHHYSYINPGNWPLYREFFARGLRGLC